MLCVLCVCFMCVHGCVCTRQITRFTFRLRRFLLRYHLLCFLLGFGINFLLLSDWFVFHRIY